MEMKIHIDRLVLHGFANLPVGRIGPAVEAHLAGLIADQGIPAGLNNSVQTPRLDGGEFEFDAGATPEEIASLIARQIAEQLAQLNAQHLAGSFDGAFE